MAPQQRYQIQCRQTFQVKLHLQGINEDSTFKANVRTSVCNASGEAILRKIELQSMQRDEFSNELTNSDLPVPSSFILGREQCYSVITLVSQALKSPSFSLEEGRNEINC